MNSGTKNDKFHRSWDNFKPDEFSVPRLLAFFSGAVTLADDALMIKMLRSGEKYAVAPEWYYEIILQSYLFLGFPRMLTAAECFNRVFPGEKKAGHNGQVTPEEAERWYREGLNLCKKIYAHNYDPLKDRVEQLAPEIFRWMIIEGYGKVLSRPQLDIRIRELSIITMLMIENREKQLYSHIRGAINVGVSGRLLKTIVEDIGKVAGDGYSASLKMIERLGVS